MARVSYTALRSLANGVLLNDTVNFDFEVSQLDRSTKPIVGSQISLSGYQETMRDRTDVFYKAVTVPVLEAEFDNLRMFLDSCDGGAQFTFDAYGTFAVPVDPQNVVISSKGYKEKRISQRYLSVSFTVRIHP